MITRYSRRRYNGRHTSNPVRHPHRRPYWFRALAWLENALDLTRPPLGAGHAG